MTPYMRSPNEDLHEVPTSVRYRDRKEMEGARGRRVGSERLMGTEAQCGKRREFWRRMVEMAV